MGEEDVPGRKEKGIYNFSSAFQGSEEETFLPKMSRKPFCRRLRLAWKKEEDNENKLFFALTVKERQGNSQADRKKKVDV